MDTRGMKGKDMAGAGRCAAPCAGAASSRGTTITAWRGWRCVSRAWGASPGGISPGSAAGRGGPRTTTLYDLSLEDAQTAQALHQRIRQLEEEQAREEDGERRLLLADRLRLLRSMWRDTREVARHLEHYYEKGVSRNEKYLIR